MAELKTKKTESSVETFLNGITDAGQREDSFLLLNLMKEITGQTPKMWGPSMVGFGDHHYVYETGHEGDIFQMGFSPRKTALTIYGLLGNQGSAVLLPKLGKSKRGKGCLYVKRLEDVDLAVLRDMMRLSWAHKDETSCSKPKPTPAKKAPKKNK